MDSTSKSWPTTWHKYEKNDGKTWPQDKNVAYLVWMNKSYGSAYKIHIACFNGTEFYLRDNSGGNFNDFVDYWCEMPSSPDEITGKN